MRNFLRLVTAGPMFFVSSWVLMLFGGIVHRRVGILPFGYETAMIVTIGLWLTIAPAIAAVSRGRKSAFGGVATALKTTRRSVRGLVRGL